METIVLEYLSAGVDVATLVLAYFIWRLERRMFRLEALAAMKVGIDPRTVQSEIDKLGPL